MNISQRQATIAVLGFQMTAIIILWLGQLFSKPGNDLLTLGAGLAALVYGGMLFAYLRGWEYARHISVVLITLIVAAFLPEPFVTTYAPFLILLGPILALVLTNPRWVIGSAIATTGILLLRADGVGVYASVMTLLNYAMLIAGLVVSRMVTETTRLQAERTENALRASEEHQHYLANLIENVSDAIISTDTAFNIRSWNHAAEILYGWRAEEVTGQPLNDFIQSEFVDTTREQSIAQVLTIGVWKGEVIQCSRDGRTLNILSAVSVLRDGDEQTTGLVAINRDITGRKHAEQKIELQNRRLSILREIDSGILAAHSVEDIVGAALDHIRELIDCRRANLTLIDRGTNEAVIFGVRTAGETSIPAGRRLPLAQFKDILPTLLQNQPILFSDLGALADPMPGIQSLLKDGLRSTCSLPLFSQGSLIGMFSMHSEIPGFFDEEKIGLAREVANQVAIALTQANLLANLRDTQARVTGIINSAMDAIISIDTEQCIVLFNPAAEALFQCEQAEALGKPMETFLPERFRASHAQHIQQFAQTGVTSRAIGKLGTIFGLRSNGEEFPIEASISQTLVKDKNIFTVILRDVTERQRAEDELKRSNTELEQFAYVASHDLQEPLRAVAGMVQLLGQRYKGKLDERADEYIGHAVEAATRMQSLINDLLDYSRVGRLGKPFAATRMEKTLDAALANLQIAIQESGAQITRDPLPTLMADSLQLTQVLQNLIGNAIKFRGAGSPTIHIGAEKLEHGWRFAVRDNGIGIEPQYFERIFLVFQRLHTRREYSGTGIGLSLCKKIVERHGGKIWLESQTGQGSTFYFTIPERQP